MCYCRGRRPGLYAAARPPAGRLAGPCSALLPSFDHLLLALLPFWFRSGSLSLALTGASRKQSPKNTELGSGRRAETEAGCLGELACGLCFIPSEKELGFLAA